MQFNQLLKAGFSDMMLSKDFNEQLFDLAFNDLLKHEGKVTYRLARTTMKDEKYNGFTPKEKNHFTKLIKEIIDLKKQIKQLEIIIRGYNDEKRHKK